MHKRKLILFLVLAAFSGSYLGSADPPTVSAQTQTARCTAEVPRNWGEFRGATEQGFAFEDQAGTVRIIRQLPCPGLGPPQVAIELQRK